MKEINVSKHNELRHGSINDAAYWLNFEECNERELRAASVRHSVMKKVLVAPLATMTDDMAARLHQDNRLTGKRIGGHLCVVATPKN